MRQFFELQLSNDLFDFNLIDLFAKENTFQVTHRLKHKC